MESRLLLHLYIIELMFALSIYDIKFIRAHILFAVYNIEHGYNYYITDCGLLHVKHCHIFNQLEHIHIFVT